MGGIQTILFLKVQKSETKLYKRTSKERELYLVSKEQCGIKKKGVKLKCTAKCTAKVQSIQKGNNNDLSAHVAPKRRQIKHLSARNKENTKSGASQAI